MTGGERVRALGIGALVVTIGVALLGAPGTALSRPATTPAGAKASASAASSASASLAATASAAPSASAAPAPVPILQLHKGAPPPPPPTAAQLKALGLLEGEEHQYEAGARDFRNMLTLIVRHHYEEKRKRVLSTLNHEINLEQKNLTDARDEAIRRLEHFIAMYSGPNADPKATPDAMFRLAALYEERARANPDADLKPGLKPAIALYRRIIREFPHYEEIAAVHYYLGHAYTDSGEIDQGQQAWRALVCSNMYQVKDDPKNPDLIELQPLVQDHDQKFWQDWSNKHPLPLDQSGKGHRAVVNPKAAPTDEELVFRDPYPETCTPIPQKTEPGEEPRYLAEVWWEIGNYHFDQLGLHAGPYSLDRAESAYDHALQFKKPPLYGVALYKLAWTYYKEQRYKTAVQEFVKLLYYTDEQQKKTGDTGADFRAEAYTYIAGSLTYVDFKGPPQGAPFIPRNDVLDTEPDPLKAEQEMAIALQRVQDPTLIPQDKKWTVEIYKSLAQEFIDIPQNRNAIAAFELTLKKFPMDRDAPVMQNKIAELYDQLARLAPDGSAAKAEYAAKALDARTKLAAYVGTTPWTDANRDDPEALQQAEQLVKNGLKRAAADHTNQARAYYNKALELSDANEQKALIQKAISEYRLAETGWGAYYAQDPNAVDAYDSKFWLADARYWVVVLQIAIDQTPTPEEIKAARDAAIAVRDSNEDNKYLQPAAYYVVTIAEKVLQDDYRRYKDSNGAEGIPERTAVKFTGTGDNRQVVSDPLPQPVLDAVHARDEYNARIPLDQDPKKNGLLYAFQSADYYFLYGHFDEARKRFDPLYKQYCGKNEWGFKSWEKLLSMADFQKDTKLSRSLVEGKSCAYNEETKVKEEGYRKPVIQGIAYLDARKAYEEAEKMPDGPARNKKWLEAAARYKAALDAAPARNEAPEAAMNGAYAYKQVGEYDKAIEMYNLFISHYGDEKTLSKLQNGDPKANPPVAPNPKEYEQRVKYLKSAEDALAGAYVLFFNYPKAADTYDKISDNPNFGQDDRRGAARQALQLYSSLGDDSGMSRARSRLEKLGSSPKQMAEADFIVASAELKKWDEFSPDTGANALARRRADQAMENYYVTHKKSDAAAQYVVQAAYAVAKTKRAAHSGDTDKWWKNTIAAFEHYKAVAPRKDGKSTAVGSAEASMAAEGEYRILDEQIGESFDYDTGHHRYKGTAVEVINQYKKDAVTAKKWNDKLQHIVDEYVSREWTAAAVSRQGSLYDSLRTGLYNTRPPALKMFNAKMARVLKMAANSNNPDLQEKADAVKVKVEQAWRKRRDQELESDDQIMVNRYATAIVLARRYNVSNPAVTRAIRRLAFFTDVIGEAKMGQYASGVQDLNYTPGMFPKMRPGMITTPKPKILPHPLPVLAE
jgi:hypothetical protein